MKGQLSQIAVVFCFMDPVNADDRVKMKVDFRRDDRQTKGMHKMLLFRTIAGFAIAIALYMAPAIGQTITLDEVLQQNRGVDTGYYPLGLPTRYSWYKKGGGPGKGPIPSPSGFTSLAGWTHIFIQTGQPDPPADCKISVKNFKAYLINRSTNAWVLVQDMAGMSGGIDGGYFKAVISPANEGATGAVITPLQPDGSQTISAPRKGTMTHFWPKNRASYPADTMSAGYFTIDLKVDKPGCKLISMSAADWWRDPSAPFLSTFANNPGVGSTDWLPIPYDQYKTMAFTPWTREQLIANPPPPLKVTATPTSTPTPTPFSVPSLAPI
jgi:hypothetical protein